MKTIKVTDDEYLTLMFALLVYARESAKDVAAIKAVDATSAADRSLLIMSSKRVENSKSLIQKFNTGEGV